MCAGCVSWGSGVAAEGCDSASELQRLGTAARQNCSASEPQRLRTAAPQNCSARSGRAPGRRSGCDLSSPGAAASRMPPFAGASRWFGPWRRAPRHAGRMNREGDARAGGRRRRARGRCAECAAVAGARRGAGGGAAARSACLNGERDALAVPDSRALSPPSRDPGGEPRRAAARAWRARWRPAPGAPTPRRRGERGGLGRHRCRRRRPHARVASEGGQARNQRGWAGVQRAREASDGG